MSLLIASKLIQQLVLSDYIHNYNNYVILCPYKSMTGLMQGRVDSQVLLLIWLWLVLITKQSVEHSMIIDYFILGREWSTGDGISELILWTKKVWKYIYIYNIYILYIITNEQKDIQVVIKHNTAMQYWRSQCMYSIYRFKDQDNYLLSKCLSNQSSTYTMDWSIINKNYHIIHWTDM